MTTRRILRVPVRVCVLVGIWEVCAGLDGFFVGALSLLLLRLYADVAAVARAVAEAFFVEWP